MNKQKLSYYCKICNNKIGWLSGLYGSGLCCSCAQKGKKHSEATKKKIGKKVTGSKNGNYKGKVKIECLQCNKIFKILPYQVKKRKFCSLDCHYKYAKGKNNSNFGNKWTKEQKEKQGKITIKAMKKVDMKKILAHIDRTGKKNGRYIDGRNPLTMAIRHLKESKSWKEKVFKRDNYTCQECGQIGGSLEAHHKKAFTDLLQEFLKEYDQFSSIEDKETLIRLAMKWQPFWEIDNGKTLCEDCHNITKREAFNYG